MVDIPDGEDLQAKISQWSQGDYVLGDHAMLWGYHSSRPITDVSREASEDAVDEVGMSLVGESVAGLVVLSQTCDIVRDYQERPYVQVAPLVKMPTEAAVRSVQRRSQPKHAFLPTLAGAQLVVELDRIFTVEKTFLAIWDRQPGLTSDEDRRSFTETMKRYYTRPALPNDFVKGIENLRRWIHEKNDRKSEIGDCIRAVEMILVRPDPSWEAPTKQVHFTIVRGPESEKISAHTWQTFVDTYKSKVVLPAGYSIAWTEHSLDNLPAKVYFGSDVLDLEYLSDETRRTK